MRVTAFPFLKVVGLYDKIDTLIMVCPASKLECAVLSVKWEHSDVNLKQKIYQNGFYLSLK